VLKVALDFKTDCAAETRAGMFAGHGGQLLLF
jgi:hypothetical protein